MEEDESRALEALRAALDAGAQAAEILCVQSQGFDSVAAGGAPRLKPVSETRLSARVWIDGGREGFASATGRRLRGVVGAALKAAEAAPRGSARGPVERTPPRPSIPGTDDPRFDYLTRQDRLEVVESAEGGPLAVAPDLQVFDVGYADRREVRSFVTSRGSRVRERTTRYSVQALVRDPVTELQLHQVFGDRSFATVASVPFSIGLARRLVELRGDSHPVDGPIRTALSPWAVAQIVAELRPHFAMAALEGASSFLARAREGGDLRFAPLVHLVDDGRLPGGLGSRSFDDRGVQPLPLTLIRDGRVEGWWVGLDQARALGARPTGHEREGRVAANNLIVRSGLRSMNAVLAEQTVPVLCVDHFRDLSAGFDPQTGAIRCEVSGHLVGPRNVPIGPVRRAVLSGSLPDVLASVLDLSSDTERLGSIDAAGMLCDGFVVEPA